MRNGTIDCTKKNGFCGGWETYYLAIPLTVVGLTKIRKFPISRDLTRNALVISGVSGSCVFADTENVDPDDSYLDIVLATTIVRTNTVSPLTELRLILYLKAVKRSRGFSRGLTCIIARRPFIHAVAFLCVRFKKSQSAEKTRPRKTETGEKPNKRSHRARRKLFLDLYFNYHLAK